MIIAPGIYPELSADYHSAQLTPTPALTQSGIKVLLDETPFDFQYRPAPEPSEEMQFGSVVHAIALGKGAKFAIAPFDDYRSKEARAWRDETIAAGLIPIKDAKYKEAAAVGDALRFRIVQTLGDEDFQTEVPFFWQEGETWCGGCLDVWHPKKRIALDAKITASVGRRAASQIIAYGWDLQHAWYRRGLEAITGDRVRFANILVKPVAPYTSRLVTLNEGWRASAERECLRALEIYQQCEKTGVWPGYPEGGDMLDAPAWLLGQRMMETDDE